MSLRAYFNSDRLIFEKLNELPCSKWLSIPYSSEEENGENAIDVTDVKTGVCFRVTLSEYCPFVRLCVGEYKQQWPQKILQVIQVFHSMHNHLTGVIADCRKHTKHGAVRTKIAESQIKEVTADITKSLVFFPHNDFHIKLYGLHVFSKHEPQNNHLFFNIKKASNEKSIVIGKGNNRTYKLCCEIPSRSLCAKGVKKIADKKDVEGEVSVLSALRNKPGIVHTYASSCSNGKYFLFQPYYPFNLLSA